MKEPQYIKIDEDGDKYYFKDTAMIKLHRTDGPAIEYANGSKLWSVDGKLHRIDGPAYEYADGHKEWYVDGKLHRLDGPAVEYADGGKLWFVHDKSLTEEEFNKLTKEIILTMDEIAAKFGVDVSKLKIVK